jgi:hypothetical protein
MSPAKSSMPSRRKRSPAPRKSSLAEEAFIETPPIISPEEKHQLILAHSAQRAPRNPLQRVELWGGVAIAFGAILVGWFFTVGQEVKLSLGNLGNGVNPLADRLGSLTDEVERDGLEGRMKLPSPTASAAAKDLVGIMKTFMASTSSAEARDLFVPPAAATATSNETGGIPGLEAAE